MHFTLVKLALDPFVQSGEKPPSNERVVSYGSSRYTLLRMRELSLMLKDEEHNDNDNDNDTLREVQHLSDEGLALQARVYGS